MAFHCFCVQLGGSWTLARNRVIIFYDNPDDDNDKCNEMMMPLYGVAAKKCLDIRVAPLNLVVYASFNATQVVQSAIQRLVGSFNSSRKTHLKTACTVLPS